MGILRFFSYQIWGKHGKIWKNIEKHGVVLVRRNRGVLKSLLTLLENFVVGSFSSRFYSTFSCWQVRQWYTEAHGEVKSFASCPDRTERFWQLQFPTKFFGYCMCTRASRTVNTVRLELEKKIKIINNLSIVKAW